MRYIMYASRTVLLWVNKIITLIYSIWSYRLNGYSLTFYFTNEGKTSEIFNRELLVSVSGLFWCNLFSKGPFVRRSDIALSVAHQERDKRYSSSTTEIFRIGFRDSILCIFEILIRN